MDHPPDSAAPAPATFRRDVQGVRGVAVLLVVAFHAGLALRGGFVGVDVFFVISGFVITQSLLRELESTGSVSLASFYARRIRRLLPAFALVVVTVLVVSARTMDIAGGQQSVARTARAAALFAANVQLQGLEDGYFARDVETNPLLHTWSLSVEEQFYAVLPALVLVVWRLGRVPGRSLAWLRGTTGAIAALSFGAAVVVVAGGQERAAFYLAPLRAWEFLVGVLLALHAHRLATVTTRAASGLALVGGTLVLGSAVVLTPASSFPGVAALPAVLGTALLIVGGTAPSALGSALRSRPLVWVGDRSYAWYLWHWPAITFALLLWPRHEGWVPVAAAVAALAPAMLSHHLVEEPIRRTTALSGVAAAALALALVNLPLGAAAVVETTADEELAAAAPELGLRTTSFDIGCEEIPWPAATCTYGPDRAPRTIALVGDSHALVWADLLGSLGHQMQFDTAVIARPGCPASVRATDHSEECPGWQRHLLDEIDRLDPDAVVVANRSPTYLLGPGEKVAPILDADLVPAADHAAALRIWEDGLRGFLDAIDRPTLIVSTVPEHHPRTGLLVGKPISDEDLPVRTIEEHEQRAAPAAAVEARVAAERPDVHVLDPARTLCTETCPIRLDGTWIYSDDDHLNPVGTLLLEEPFRALLHLLLEGGTSPESAQG